MIEENCIFEVAIEMNFAMEVSNGVRMRVQLLKVAHETKCVAVNRRCNNGRNMKLSGLSR